MTDIQRETEGKMLQKYKETIRKVERQNMDMYGLKSNREEWDKARMRNNDYPGRSIPKFNQD